MNGKILKKLRLECDLTQEQLSKEIGVSPSTVRMIELGKREGSNEVVDKIADIFNVSLDYLLGRTKQKQNLYMENGILLNTLNDKYKRKLLIDLCRSLDNFNIITK